MAGEEDLMKQVEELKKKLAEVEEEKEETRRGREEARVRRESRGGEETRGGEYMMRVSGAGGLASRAMGSAVHVEQQGTGNNDMRQFYFPSEHLRPLPWPQQDPQQQQPQQQLISYDSDGGWVRGGIDCGAGVPPPNGNGGDGGGQQPYIGGHGSSDGSGGGNSSGGSGDNGDSGVDIGGGDNGYTLVAGGSDLPPNWVVEEQQDGRNYAEDDSGP